MAQGEGRLTLRLPLVSVREGELVEEEVEVVADASGRVIGGPFPTLEDALRASLESLESSLKLVERALERLEYALEIGGRADPRELHGAVYAAHALFHAALHVHDAAGDLLRAGRVPRRLYARARTLLRGARRVRGYARVVMLLHATLTQLSLERSVRRLTWLGTFAVPALLISSAYGMNLKWLPLADNPAAVFLVIALATGAFALALSKL
jgi:hypothetical protein